MNREIATFEDVYSRPPTEDERAKITSCGFEIACVDRVNGYHCPIVDCNGTYDGGMVYDVCRVCGGDNSSCLGCDGVPVAVSRRLLRLVWTGACVQKNHRVLSEHRVDRTRCCARV